MKFRFIQRHAERFRVARMCRALRVSRSGYYGWLQRPECPRVREDRRLRVEVRAAYQTSRGTYGSPRVHAELQDQGRAVSRKRVARLMRTDGLVARKRRRTRITTDSAHAHPIAPNRLDRRFQVEGPDRVWLGDITYLAIQRRWFYLAVLMDLASRRIVGWAAGGRMGQELVLQALESALSHRQPPTGLLHHSDRGSQYTAKIYRSRLKAYGIESSMSRQGDCYDNAPMESFFSTLKTELPAWGSLKTPSQARSVLFNYIESFYNTRRRHSALGYLSPAEFERRHAEGEQVLSHLNPNAGCGWTTLPYPRNVP